MGILGAIGSIAGYALGGPAGAAIGGQIGGGIDTNQANADAAQAAMNFSASQYATRYQTTVKDLEAAGLSPMLAYSQGAGTPPTGVSYTSQNPYAGLASSYQSVANLDAQRQQLLSSANQADTQADVNTQMIDKVKADIDKVKGDTNYDTQQAILRATAYSLKEQGDLNQDLAMTQGQLRAQMQATIENLQKDGTLKGLDIEAAKKFNNWGRQFKEISPFVDLIIHSLLKR